MKLSIQKKPDLTNRTHSKDLDYSLFNLFSEGNDVPVVSCGFPNNADKLAHCTCENIRCLSCSFTTLLTIISFHYGFKNHFINFNISLIIFTLSGHQEEKFAHRKDWKLQSILNSSQNQTKTFSKPCQSRNFFNITKKPN